jgi:hypothetical protein
VVQYGEATRTEINDLSGNSMKNAGFSHAFCVEFSRMGRYMRKNAAKNAGNARKTCV